MRPGETYHIFNHANGNENLFAEEKNYDFFLSKLATYILPVCDIYAYCLMPNHFHLMVKIKEENELCLLWKKEFSITELEIKVSKSFSNLFSSYAQSFNKVYKRIGSLFIPSMKKELINDDDYFLKIVHYIHANPVHHGFRLRMEDWKHSSYKIFLSTAPTKLKRDFVLNEFNGIDQFILYHQQPIDLKINTLE